MGYYAPSFGGLDRGWYFSTTDKRYAEERDRCLRWWNTECDAVVEDYLARYGMFFSAFERDIKKEVRAGVSCSVEFPGYFGYFIVSRVLAIPRLASLYRADYERRAHKTRVCEICGAEQTYDDIHPSLIGRTQRVLPLCNECWFWVAEFAPLDTLADVTEDFKERVRRLSKDQQCPICRRSFVWLNKGIRYSFELPFLPAKHIEICPRCVEKALFGGPNRENSARDLEDLKRVADLLGTVPDKTGFVYDQAQTLETAVEVTRLMHRMRPFGEIAKKYGSWFKALVASGVLPDGVRRTGFGTMVLARDEHECLSLAEKTIDDLLFLHGIPHEKEPQYPGAPYKADWKIHVAGSEVYVELFGLDGKPAYTKRKREKLAFADKAGLTVVALERRDLSDLRRAFRTKILKLLPDREAQPGP